MATDKQAPDDGQNEDQESPQDESQEQAGGQGDDSQAELAPDEQYASDDEMNLMYKAMANIFQALTTGSKTIIGILSKSPNLAKTMGDMTFHSCSEVFASAAKAGEPLPIDIFMMQGGCVYQTIDAISDLAEAGKLTVTDEDRKNALGYAIADYMHSRMDMKNITPDDFKSQIQDMSSRGGQPSGIEDLPQNPVSQGVSQGLQGQGVLGNMSNG